MVKNLNSGSLKTFVQVMSEFKEHLDHGHSDWGVNSKGNLVVCFYPQKMRKRIKIPKDLGEVEVRITFEPEGQTVIERRSITHNLTLRVIYVDIFYNAGNCFSEQFISAIYNNWSSVAQKGE